MEGQKEPKVVLIGTGGTISSVGRHNLDLVEYGDAGQILEADELLERLPEATTVAQVRPVCFRSLLSTGMTPKDWLDLARTIHTVGQEHAVDGFVITHGTATLEETAYFLNLTLRVPQTVVLVGAQRPASALSTDAYANLLGAIRVAASPEARGLGVLVVLNDEIQAAREVTKTSTYRLETFRSPDMGFLGYVDADGQVVIYRRPTRRHAPDAALDITGLESLPRVDIVYAYAGADGALIDAAVAAGAQGIVIAGLAPGKPTPLQQDALERAGRAGVLVVQSSRAGSGRVIRRATQRRQGVVVADNLNPQKARVLAMVALARYRDAETIQTLFDTY